MCALANIGITRPSRWPLLLALASMMLVLNAVVVATIAAVTLARASRAGPALRSRRWNSASA